jgi:Outer membrane protein beta-barrel domain
MLLSSHRLACGTIAAMLLILPASAPAQEIGVKGGASFATLTPEEDEEPDISRRVGAVGGVWVRTPPHSRLSFQVEGLFAEKGVKFESGGFGAEVALRYIEVPLLARAGFGASASAVRGFLVGGAAPAFKVSARGKATADGQEQTRDIDDAISAGDLGLVGGGGLEFGRVLVEARYTHGLLHINTDDNGDEDRIKNRVFSVMVGFRLR